MMRSLTTGPVCTRETYPSEIFLPVWGILVIKTTKSGVESNSVTREDTHDHYWCFDHPDGGQYEKLVVWTCSCQQVGGPPFHVVLLRSP